MSERDHQPKRFPSCAETDNYLLEIEAELSRMRTALEGLHAKWQGMADKCLDAQGNYLDEYSRGYYHATDGAMIEISALIPDADAAIAERALTAGSGNE